MKIKKLHIHGFKSFVDKSVISFHEGTSAIIGPNGCGKSNIVDAIRWVLGEQNARHLRGKLMEDIIFNGSDARKPLGMAEVVLTFSTEGGRAPAAYADFSEIEISRRLYRSGESEYYINKVQSRLRDIVDLFADTGIGTRAYSIIEQGQVGWLVNAKPEERRAIFEEAAGISKFKHKREAALRKLDSAKENLTRVSDIIAEVKRQLNSLNRQAKKAERYKALREELRSVEISLGAFEQRRVKERLREADESVRNLNDEEIRLQSEISSNEALLEEAKAGHLGVEARFNDARSRLFEVEKEILAEERSIELVRARSEELRRAKERLQQEIGELSAKKAALEAELIGLGSTESSTNAELDAKQGRLAEASRLLDAKSALLRSKEDAIRAIKADSILLFNKANEIRGALQSLIKDEEQLRAREARGGVERQKFSDDLFATTSPLSQLRSRIDDATSQRASIEGAIESRKTRITSIEERSGVEAKRLTDKRDEASRILARLGALEDLERNFEELSTGVRALLKGNTGGIHGLLADVIEANPGYEAAVEAAMGERLKYVVVEDFNEGEKAISSLEHGSGRASFVPLRNLKQPRVPVTAGGGARPGVKSLLGEVRVREGFEDIVNCLLSDTIIVEDLRSAIELFNEEGVYRTLVTRSGEVVDQYGVMTGGAVKGDAGILQRRGEIKRLRAAATEIEDETRTTEEALTALNSELNSERTAFEKDKDALHAIDLERVKISEELKRGEEEKDRLERAIAAIDAEKTGIGQRFEEISVKKTALSSEREAVEAELEKTERASTALSDEVSHIRHEREEVLHSVTGLKVEIAQAQERLSALSRLKSERERAIADTLERGEAKRREIESGEHEEGEIAHRLTEGKERVEALLASKDACKADEVAIAEAMQESAGRIAGVEASLKDLKSGLSRAQETKNSLAIEQKELEIGLAHLYEKIAEKYGADIRQVAPDETVDEAALAAQRDDLRTKISELGEVSLSALEEYSELERRHEFLLEQQTDLSKSVESLLGAINRINRSTREKFIETFEEIRAKFSETFPRFFNGGRGELRLTDEGDVLESGVEIVVQPPGKRLQNMTLLSGGEKALTATALIFSIFLIKPSPFCLLDEVDAPLDDANIDRFNTFVKDMSELSQFILITHNKRTMEMADTLYGITMAEPGVSKVLSLRV